MNAKTNIRNTIEQFFHAMDTQNFTLMKSILPEYDNMVHIGSDRDEIWKGYNTLMKATKEQFEGLEYYQAEIYDINITISQSGNTAWYFHLLDAEIKSNGKLTKWVKARFTGVLENIEGDWKMVQTHVSLSG